MLPLIRVVTEVVVYVLAFSVADRTSQAAIALLKQSFSNMDRLAKEGVILGRITAGKISLIGRKASQIIFALIVKTFRSCRIGRR